MGNLNDPQIEIFIKINEAIYDNEQHIQDIFNKSSNPINEEGYLINLKDLEDLKINVNYEEFKKYKSNQKYNESYQDKIKSIFDNKKFQEIKKIEQIKFKNTRYITNMLLNDNKFILINHKLWEVISDNEKDIKEKAISYTILRTKIILYLENNEQLELSHKNNIFDKNSCKYNQSFNEFYQLSNQIFIYYKFEKKFLNELKNNSFSSTNGYLVSESWLNEWKNYTNYENIKNKYFDKIDEKEKEIINELINYREQYKDKYKIPNITNIVIINKINELESHLKKESLAIIDSNFSNLFPYFKGEYNLISYTLGKNQIQINLNESMIVKSYNNIILSNNDINDLIDLKILIKIFFFQKELINEINNNTKNNYVNKQNLYIINNKIFHNYKNHFEYKILSNHLNNNISNIKFKTLNNETISDIIKNIIPY